MGAFDQAARYAAQADPQMIVARLLRDQGLLLRFSAWEDTRTTPLPGGQDRTADRVASLSDGAAPAQPWLLVLEFQSQHDPDKLDVTLVEAAHLRIEMRHGTNPRIKYRVLVGLIYLQGQCPEAVLDMTLPGGAGTRHVPLLWIMANDSAKIVLEDIASGRMTWGMLFFVPLMSGGGDPETIERWKELVGALPDGRRRGDLAEIALVFAELAGCFLAWEQGLEGLEMTESMVVNRWIEKAEKKKELTDSREFLTRLLKLKFSDKVSGELLETINQQPSASMLKDWFDQAYQAATFEDFLKVVRQ